MGDGEQVGVDRATAFSTLGIDSSTSLGEARAIYRRRLRLLHPDLHGAVDPQLTLEAERATRQLSAAWQIVQEAWTETASRRTAAPEPRRAGARAGRNSYPGPYAYPDEAPGPPPPPRATPPGSEECMLCGGAPVRRARVRTVHRGSNAPGRHDQQRDAPHDERRDERLCRRCGLNAFRTAQSVTLTEGWLSLSGPFRVIPAVLRNSRAWWRYTRLHDVLPPLRPVIVTVTAPAPMVRPVLARRGPLTQALAAATAIILAVGVGIGWLVGDNSSPEPLALQRVNGAVASAGAAPSAAPTAAAQQPSSDTSLSRSQVVALRGCTSACRQVRGLAVQLNGQPYTLALVSLRGGEPAGLLRFYLLDASGKTTWYGPERPMHAFPSRQLGGHSGSVLTQDGAGHVFVDLLTGSDSSVMAVLSLRDGSHVQDFTSLGPQANGLYRFGTNTSSADVVAVDKSTADDIVLLRAAAGGHSAYYDFYQWDRTDFVFRACARQLVNGDYGSFQPAGTCG
jgi:hypothetical protein